MGFIDYRTQLKNTPTNGGSGSVTSVFDRKGDVIAQTGDYNADQVTNAVSQISIYDNPSWINSLAYSKLTEVPTAFPPTPHTHDVTEIINAVSRLGAYNNPPWILSFAYSKLTGVPSTFPPSPHTHDVSEVTNAVSKIESYQNPPWIESIDYSKITNVPPPVENRVTSVFGRFGDIIAGFGDYTAAQVSNAVDMTQSYNNPPWILSFDWAKLINVPLTFPPAPHVHDVSEVNNAVSQLGNYANPSWITALDYSKITNVPPPVGSSQTPWLQNIDADGFELNDAGHISQRAQRWFNQNIDTAGNLIDDGPGFTMITNTATRIYVAGIGAGGNMAARVEIITLEPNTTKFNQNIDLTNHFLFNAIIPSATLGSGTANATSYLRGDRVWDIIQASEVQNAIDSTQVYNNPSWITSLDYSKISNKPQTFPPSAHTHDSADIVSGVLSVARLGNGNPSSSNYLRGDGTWATISAGGSQTPWTQNIQGATFALYNAGLIQITTNRTPTSGAGLELTYDTKGYVNAYDRTNGIFKELEIHGNPLNIYSNGSNVMTINSSQIIIGATQQLILSNATGNRISLWGGSQVGFNLGVESGAFYQSNDPYCTFRWYQGQAADGVNWRMELGQNLKLQSSMILKTFGAYIGFNTEYEGGFGWRTQSTGPAGILLTGGNEFSLYTSTSSSAGAMTPITRAFYDNGSTFILNHAFSVQAGSGRKMSYFGDTELDFDFSRTDGGTNDKISRIICNGINIGFERIDDAYTQVLSYARLNRNGFDTNVPISFSTNIAMAVPRINLWYGNPGFTIGIEGGTVYHTADANCQHRWYIGVNPDGGTNHTMDLTTARLFTRCPLVQVLPTSQTDPTGFGSTGQACYMYFDPNTKKLAIRYHEQNVAYRTYWLKEGDQGSTTTIMDSPADLTGPGNASGNALLFRDTFQIPANTSSIRLTFQMTHATGASILTFMIGIHTAAATKGQMVPTGSAGYFYLFNSTKGFGPNSIMYVDVTLTKSGTGTMVAGEFWIDAGARQTFLEYKSLNNPLSSNHLFIAGTYGTNFIMRNLLAVKYF